MGVENLVVARTDSEAATLLTTNIDERDHAFILGCSTFVFFPISGDAPRQSSADDVLQ